VSTPRTFSGRIYAADAKGFLGVEVNEHEHEQIKGIMLDAPCRLTVYPEMATPPDLLTANARDVAAKLRVWAEAAAAVLANRPDAFLEEQISIAGYIEENRRLADQLDPQPVSKK
jgi:hypothetical protein